jgi:hypothetical protein
MAQVSVPRKIMSRQFEIPAVRAMLEGFTIEDGKHVPESDDGALPKLGALSVIAQRAGNAGV